jgi:hypothetical protein
VHIILGLALGAALLYFWLVGHWFARVLVWLLLGVLCGADLAHDMRAFWEGGNVTNINSAAFAIGFILAWPMADLPANYWRRQPAASSDAPAFPPQSSPRTA